MKGLALTAAHTLKPRATKIARRAMPAAVANWDQLPDSALVSRRTLAILFECCERTIRRMEDTGKLPKPDNFGSQLRRFKVGDVRRSMEST
jgi:hypothetical protein